MNIFDQAQIAVYHGTNSLFDDIDLSKSKNKRDFGCGFYTTTLYEQACVWAQNVSMRNGGNQYVYEYVFTPDAALNIKRFEGLTVEWLDMVKENRRNGGLQHHYDVVIGPVANDNTMRTVALYVSGVYTASMAIEQLRFFKANDQVTFHTQKALEALRFVRRIEL